MSYQTAQRFLSKYGQDRLLWLRAAMNDEKMLQRSIAEELRLSEARVCQVCLKLGKWRWDFRQSTVDALKFELSVKKRDAAMIRAAIREHDSIKESGLQLIIGGDIEQVYKR